MLFTFLRYNRQNIENYNFNLRIEFQENAMKSCQRIEILTHMDSPMYNSISALNNLNCSIDWTNTTLLDMETQKLNQIICDIEQLSTDSPTISVFYVSKKKEHSDKKHWQESIIGFLQKSRKPCLIKMNEHSQSLVRPNITPKHLDETVERLNNRSPPNFLLEMINTCKLYEIELQNLKMVYMPPRKIDEIIEIAYERIYKSSNIATTLMYEFNTLVEIYDFLYIVRKGYIDLLKKYPSHSQYIDTENAIKYPIRNSIKYENMECLEKDLKNEMRMLRRSTRTKSISIAWGRMFDIIQSELEVEHHFLCLQEQNQNKILKS